MDIRFNNLVYLHLLWVVPLLFVVVFYGFRRKVRALHRFATSNLVAGLIPQVSFARQWVKALLLLVAMVAVVLGLIDPRWGVTYEEVPRRGIDIMFVLDVSRSMLAEDIRPNRLERAKQSIGDVLEVLGGDRVGLVTFAGSPVLKCPLTVNYGALRMILDETEPLGTVRGGSLLGDAVRLASDSFADDIKQYKAIIIISDGEDQESFPVEAARKAFNEKGIRVYTVGIGDTETGARIPVEKDGRKTYLQYEGQEVWTKMQPETLREMAVAAGGIYIPAGTSSMDLGQLYLDRIAPQDMREFETSRIERYHVRFQWFAGLALVLLLVETLMTDRRTASSVETPGGGGMQTR